MKIFAIELKSLLRLQHNRNFKLLIQLLSLLILLILIDSYAFVHLMQQEGRHYDFITGIYWTIISMTTAGYGEIVFTQHPGQIFSAYVVTSGIIFLFILLPAFIQFLYAPLVEAQTLARVPRQLPKDTEGHIILTNLDSVTENLIRKLENYKYTYALVEPNLDKALQLHDRGIKVLHGNLDNPEFCKNIRIRKASLLAATSSDAINTNITFTVRELAEKLPIISTADNPDTIDILKLAGSSHVLQVHEMMGQFLARRAMEGDYAAHIVAHFDSIVLAEISVKNTPFAEKTIAESKLREEFGMTVVGIWDRSWFESSAPNKLISSHAILVVACSEEQLEQYNKKFYVKQTKKNPVIIIGAGRVGTSAARTLEEQGVPYQIIEKSESQIRSSGKKCIHGDASSREILLKAGIKEASSIIVSTRDDDTNIYLTIYCRQLRPDALIISRATLPRNVGTLQRAGADFVLSYASLGANAIFNILQRGDVFMIAEGLNIFKTPLPNSLKGKTLIESNIRPKTGCHVIALDVDGDIQLNPDPNKTLSDNTEIILAGSLDAEAKFLKIFGK